MTGFILLQYQQALLLPVFERTADVILRVVKLVRKRANRKILRTSGNAAARELPDTRRVLKKPNTKVPRMAKAGFQLAKITSATAIQP